MLSAAWPPPRSPTEWLGFNEPDPTNIQFKTMVAGVQRVQTTNRWPLERMFVWVDYSSVPQAHRPTMELAINSLAVYSSRAHAFVVVVPRTTHHDSGEIANDDTYRKRLWTRAECLTHLLVNGRESMWVATGPESNMCRKMPADWLRGSTLCIFSGDATCCDKKHRGMDHCDRELLVGPLLGLYGSLYAEARTRKIVDPKEDPKSAQRFGHHRVSSVASLDDIALEDLREVAGAAPVPSSSAGGAAGGFGRRLSAFAMGGLGGFGGNLRNSNSSLAEESQSQMKSSRLSARTRARMHEYELIAQFESDVFPREFQFTTEEHPSGAVLANLFGDLIPLMKTIIEQDSQLRALLNQQRSRLHARRKQFEVRLNQRINRGESLGLENRKGSPLRTGTGGGPVLAAACGGRPAPWPGLQCGECDDDSGPSAPRAARGPSDDLEAGGSQAEPTEALAEASYGASSVFRMLGLAGNSSNHGGSGGKAHAEEARSEEAPGLSHTRAWKPHMDSKQLRAKDAGHSRDSVGGKGHGGEGGEPPAKESHHRRISREMGDMLCLDSGVIADSKEEILDSSFNDGSFNQGRSLHVDAKLRRRWSFSALHLVVSIDPTQPFEPPRVLGGSVEDRLTLAASVGMIRRKAEWLGDEKEYAADSSRHQTSHRNPNSQRSAAAKPGGALSLQTTMSKLIKPSLGRQITRTDLNLQRCANSRDGSAPSLRNHRGSVQMAFDNDTLKFWKNVATRASAESRKSRWTGFSEGWSEITREIAPLSRKGSTCRTGSTSTGSVLGGSRKNSRYDDGSDGENDSFSSSFTHHARDLAEGLSDSFHRKKEQLLSVMHGSSSSPKPPSPTSQTAAAPGRSALKKQALPRLSNARLSAERTSRDSRGSRLSHLKEDSSFKKFMAHRKKKASSKSVFFGDGPPGGRNGAKGGGEEGAKRVSFGDRNPQTSLMDA